MKKKTYKSITKGKFRKLYSVKARLLTIFTFKIPYAVCKFLSRHNLIHEHESYTQIIIPRETWNGQVRKVPDIVFPKMIFSASCIMEFIEKRDQLWYQLVRPCFLWNRKKIRIIIPYFKKELFFNFRIPFHIARVILDKRVFTVRDDLEAPYEIRFRGQLEQFEVHFDPIQRITVNRRDNHPYAKVSVQIDFGKVRYGYVISFDEMSVSNPLEALDVALKSFKNSLAGKEAEINEILVGVKNYGDFMFEDCPLFYYLTCHKCGAPLFKHPVERFKCIHGCVPIYPERLDPKEYENRLKYFHDEFMYRLGYRN
jgi:hypothetical protein